VWCVVHHPGEEGNLRAARRGKTCEAGSSGDDLVLNFRNQNEDALLLVRC
jgi:hypothetical protein